MDDPRAYLLKIEEEAEELARRKRENRLADYAPYPKQALFHAMGATKRERLFEGANQSGKTTAGSMECAAHLTGIYPDWWQGKRFTTPTRGWALGVTSEAVREAAQRLLMGPPEAWGTGSIPKARIIGHTLNTGIRDAIDTVRIRHFSGGTSSLAFKSYERGREKLQGSTLHFVWGDEEPPADIYAELLARITATDGVVYLTATPLLGMSEVVSRFERDESPDRGVIRMALDEVAHLTPEQRAVIIAGYRPHEREARARGIPMLGSGRVFPISQAAIEITPFRIPAHLSHIGGMDFGYDHPFGAVKLAWDRDEDIVYVTHAYRQAEASAVIHVASIKPWGESLPWAWPHDGAQHDKGSGEALAGQYRRHGLSMLGQHAQFEEGGFGVEASIADMLERMQTGRLRVFSHLVDWFDEFLLYHRKDGKVVKERDDLLSATRYALMMLRYARVLRTGQAKPRGRVARGIDFALT